MLRTKEQVEEEFNEICGNDDYMNQYLCCSGLDDNNNENCLCSGETLNEKILYHIHKIREEDREEIQDEMRGRWDFEVTGNVEYIPSYESGYNKCEEDYNKYIEESIKIIKNEIGFIVDKEGEQYVKCYIDKYLILEKLNELKKELYDKRRNNI